MYFPFFTKQYITKSKIGGAKIGRGEEIDKIDIRIENAREKARKP